MRVYAILTGPNYWAPNHDRDSIEVWDSITAARESLRDRYASNGRRPCEYTTAAGDTVSTYFPGVDIGTSLTLYAAPSHTELTRRARETSTLDGVPEEWESYIPEELGMDAEDTIYCGSPEMTLTITARGIRREDY